jgi:hypothetical protein
MLLPGGAKRGQTATLRALRLGPQAKCKMVWAVGGRWKPRRDLTVYEIVYTSTDGRWKTARKIWRAR